MKLDEKTRERVNQASLRREGMRYPDRDPVKFQSIFERVQKLHERLARPTSVELRGVISREEFHQQYVERNCPVVIRGAVAEWKLLSVGPDEIKRRLLGAPILVHAGNYVKNMGFRGHRADLYSMEDFLEEITSGPFVPTEEDPLPPYLSSKFPELEDLIAPLSYFDGDTVEDPGFWLGQDGCVTKAHIDFYQNLVVQVWGRKHLKLYSPDQTHLLGCILEPGSTSVCAVNPDAPDLSAFPQFATAQCLEVTLEPGDMLYLPFAWIHHVRTIDLSLMVNFFSTHLAASFS